MIKLISFLLRHSKGLVVGALLAGIAAGASSMGLLAVIGARINNHMPPSTLLLVFVGLCLIYPVSKAASELLLATISQSAFYNLRMQLSQRILAAPLRQLEELGSPRLYAALTDDVNSITNALLLMPTVCINMVIVIGCFIYLGWLSLPVLLMSLGFMVVGVFSYRLPMRLGNRYLRSARQQADKLYAHFRSLTQGTKELKLHAPRRDDFMSGQLDMTARALRADALRAQTVFTAAATWGQVLFYVMLGLLLFAVPAIRQVSNVALTGFALTILYMMTPLTAIITLMPILSRARVSLNKLEELGLSLSQKQGGEASTAADAPTWQSLELVDVTHVYHREKENSTFTLGPINLSFRPGEVVFLIGGNGSGKTTLAKLITGLYHPEGGYIRFNGERVTDETREQYRQLFSVVFYDFHLFENLLGLSHTRLDAQAEEYLIQLQLNHKVEVKDGRFSTLELSQGQRKRLALLTAYLEDRPFYVFDEWAADQDPLFKEIFYLQILPELKARGKTVLAISHDDRYYNLGDRLIKLENGQLESVTQLDELTHDTSPALASAGNVANV